MSEVNWREEAPMWAVNLKDLEWFWMKLSRSLAGVPVSFARGHSIPDFYHTIKDLISHNPLPGLISTHCLHLYLTLYKSGSVCHSLQSLMCVIAAILSFVVFLPLLLLFGRITCVWPVPVCGLPFINYTAFGSSTFVSWSSSWQK